MRKFPLLFIVLLTMISSAYAQNLEVTDSLSHAGSLGSVSVPFDNSGNPCAKIIIEAPIEDLEISGTYILGDVLKKTGRYEVYVSIPKKQGQKIVVRHNDLSPIEIDLWTSDGALIGREAYLIRIKRKDNTIAFSKHNQFYADVFFQAGQNMGAGLAIGAFFHAINAEIEFAKGVSKSDKIFWYDKNELIGSTTYSSWSGNVKLGYGFQFKQRFQVTPQLGFGLIKCTSGNDNPAKDANSVFALIGCRGSFTFAKHMQVTIAPYYNFAIKKSSSFEEISNLQPTINHWTNGFNVKIAFTVFI